MVGFNIEMEINIDDFRKSMPSLMKTKSNFEELFEGIEDFFITDLYKEVVCMKMCSGGHRTKASKYILKLTYTGDTIYLESNFNKMIVIFNNIKCRREYLNFSEFTVKVEFNSFRLLDVDMFGKEK